FFLSSRRRHTRSKRDWSSDVCSSDLENGIESLDQLNGRTTAIVQQTEGLRDSIRADESRLAEITVLRGHILNYVKTRDIYQAYKIGRASCRETGETK